MVFLPCKKQGILIFIIPYYYFYIIYYYYYYFYIIFYIAIFKDKIIFYPDPILILCTGPRVYQKLGPVLINGKLVCRTFVPRAYYQENPSRRAALLVKSVFRQRRPQFAPSLASPQGMLYAKFRETGQKVTHSLSLSHRPIYLSISVCSDSRNRHRLDLLFFLAFPFFSNPLSSFRRHRRRHHGPQGT